MTGGTWVSADADSVVEYNISATGVTRTNEVRIRTGLIQGGESRYDPSELYNRPLVSSIAGDSFEFAVIITTNSDSTINWTEY